MLSSIGCVVLCCVMLFGVRLCCVACYTELCGIYYIVWFHRLCHSRVLHHVGVGFLQVVLCHIALCGVVR